MTIKPTLPICLLAWIGADHAIVLHPPHQGIDRAFPHSDLLHQPGRDLVAIGVGPRQKGKDTQFQDSLPELCLDALRQTNVFRQKGR